MFVISEESEVNLPAPENKDDAEASLVARLCERDQKAIAILYDAYAPALFGVICRMVKCEVQAQEILQECFMKIWIHCHQYDPAKGRLFTWFLRIARNLAIDHFRSRSYGKSLKTQDIEACTAKEHPVNNDFKPEDIGIRELTALLPASQKEIIDLLYFGGLSQQEVAQQLEIPLGTVKTRTRTALKLLRKVLH